VNTAAFLATLRSRDIQVWADAGQLRCSAPPGTLNSEFRQELRQRKADILKFLDTVASLARQQRAIIPLQPHGTRTPVFAVGGHNGDVFCYRTLVKYFGGDQPFFGLQPPGLDGQSEPLTRVEDLAAYFATQIKALQPDGPYVIAGYCAGGSIAFELASQLLRGGSSIEVVALFGAPYATAYRLHSQIRLRLETECARIARHARALSSLSGARRRFYIREKLELARAMFTSPSPSPSQPKSAGGEEVVGLSTQSNIQNQKSKISDGERSRATDSVAEEVKTRRLKVQRATFAAIARYTPPHFPGRLVLLLPSKNWARSSRQPLRWRSVAETAEEHYGPDDCHTDVMLLEPYAPIFARMFSQFCTTHVDRGLHSSALASP
jgi:hypothetical protein